MRVVNSVIVVVLACYFLSGCDEAESGAYAPRAALSVVAAATTADAQELVGTVEPQMRTELGFQVLGRLIARDVSVGDFVRAGQRIAAIDPTSLELAVRTAEADLASARAQLANAMRDSERQQELLERKASTKALVDAAQEQRQVAQAVVDRAEASLSKAVERRGWAQIHAEFDGVITAVSAEVGRVLTPGETVITIARPDIREAVVDIPDGAVNGLAKGDGFSVGLELDPTIRTQGVLREVAPQADPSTRTRRARITLIDPPEAFRLGTTVIVVRRSQTLQRIVLPASALLDRGEKTFVWILDEHAGSVSLREVSVGRRAIGSAAIEDGVSAGERVVTAGVHSLTEGQAVRVDGAPLP